MGAASFIFGTPCRGVFLGSYARFAGWGKYRGWGWLKIYTPGGHFLISPAGCPTHSVWYWDSDFPCLGGGGSGSGAGCIVDGVAGPDNRVIISARICNASSYRREYLDATYIDNTLCGFPLLSTNLS